MKNAGLFAFLGAALGALFLIGKKGAAQSGIYVDTGPAAVMTGPDGKRKWSTFVGDYDYVVEDLGDGRFLIRTYKSGTEIGMSIYQDGTIAEELGSQEAIQSVRKNVLTILEQVGLL